MDSRQRFDAWAPEKGFATEISHRNALARLREICPCSWSRQIRVVRQFERWWCDGLKGGHASEGTRPAMLCWIAEATELQKEEGRSHPLLTMKVLEEVFISGKIKKKPAVYSGDFLLSLETARSSTYRSYAWHGRKNARKAHDEYTAAETVCPIGWCSWKVGVSKASCACTVMGSFAGSICIPLCFRIGCNASR